MDLDTVGRIRAAFYRLVGAEDTDASLRLHDEEENEVAYQCLTRGVREAQRYMLKQGYDGWRRRHGPLVFLGTDSADGGRYVAFPADLLRVAGDEHRSALMQQDGQTWGHQVGPKESHHRGSAYYILGDRLWLLKGASPPSTLYLGYTAQHPAIDDDLLDANIDFPLEARGLIVAEAAMAAVEEAWFPGDERAENRIRLAWVRARMNANDVARSTQQARKLRQPRKAGNRY